MNDSHPDPTGLILSNGRYAITKKLGEGGMGAVYRAKDNNLQADVVIKLPHPSMVTDAEFSRRFREEVKSLVLLSHPHIVKVTDVGDWDGVPFSVLQFLPGGSLEDRLNAWSGPAALPALVSWVGPVSSALDYVHSQKMVHRDVKPGNILFDAQGHAFLGDFGVVKVLAAEVDDRSGRAAMTGTGMVLGTPHYMAPELIMGDPFDGRVDQYALAVTAYELLCGRRPFEHEVPTRVLMMQAQDTPPSLASHCPWASPRLEATLLKALAKNPDDRYPTCAAFAAAVVAAAGVEQAGRARVQCGSCGQTMTVSIESLAKLSRAGRNAPCPKCGGLLDLAAGTAKVLPPTLSGERAVGGTAVLDIRGSTAEMKSLQPQAQTPASDDGTVVFGNLRVNTVMEPRLERPAATGGDKPVHRPLPMVPIGIAAAVALVACAGLFWAMSPGDSGSPEPGTATEVASAGKETPATVPASGASRDLVARNDVSDASTSKATGGLETARADVDAQPVTPTATSASPTVASRDDPFKTEPVALSTPGSEPVAPGAVTPGGAAGRTEGFGSESTTTRLANPGQGEVPPAAESKPEPTVVADDEKPAQRNVPLAKLIANPGAFAGMLITLEQVYCLDQIARKQPNGSLRVAIIESDLELTNNSAKVRLFEEFELGLDRRLADRLIRLNKMTESTESEPPSPNWNMQPANLTVKVDGATGTSPGGSARIVRVELFERFKTEVRGSYKKKLAVLFETQTVTASGSTSGLGNNDEWQKVKKLGHAYVQYQRMFDGIQRQQSQMKWAAFSSQLNNLIVQGIKQSAAAEESVQRQLRKSVTPNSANDSIRIVNPTRRPRVIYVP